MSLLWAIPPVAMVMGTLLALVQLRGMADAASDLHVELRRFGEVQAAVAEVRSASADARTITRSLRRA